MELSGWRSERRQNGEVKWVLKGRNCCCQDMREVIVEKCRLGGQENIRKGGSLDLLAADHQIDLTRNYIKVVYSVTFDY